jgi:hypothetical protein
MNCCDFFSIPPLYTETAYCSVDAVPLFSTFFGCGKFQYGPTPLSFFALIGYWAANMMVRRCYDLIMVRSILNLVVADSACGRLAGIMAISPCFRLRGLPDTVIFAFPSMM